MSQESQNQNATAVQLLASINDQLTAQNEQLRYIIQNQDSHLDAYRRSPMTKKPLSSIFLSATLGVLAAKLVYDLIYWIFAPQIVEAAIWRLNNSFF